MYMAMGWFKATICFIFLNSSIGSGASSVPQEKESAHGESCPKSCSTCDRTVEKALKFIASSQKEDGSWPVFKRVSSSEKPLVNAALNGLALFASGSTTKEGPYKDQLQKTREFVLTWDRKDSKYLISNLCDVSAMIMFLAHVYNSEKSENIKTLLERIRDIIVQEQDEDGGWNYRKSRASVSKVKESYNKGGHTFLTAEFVMLLVLMKNVGVDVNESVLEKAKKFYTPDSLLSRDGFLTYQKSKHSCSEKACHSAARTVEALWVMELLGLADSDIYKKCVAFAKERVGDVDLGNHGPAFHMFRAGIACHFSTEKALWSKYWTCYRDTIIKAQKEDGSIFIEPRKDAYWPFDEAAGKFIYTTPQYTVVLLLHKGHLLFDKLEASKRDNSK
jgi:hypothetical protein